MGISYSVRALILSLYLKSSHVKNGIRLVKFNARTRLPVEGKPCLQTPTEGVRHCYTTECTIHRFIVIPTRFPFSHFQLIAEMVSQASDMALI